MQAYVDDPALAEYDLTKFYEGALEIDEGKLFDFNPKRKAPTYSEEPPPYREGDTITKHAFVTPSKYDDEVLWLVKSTRGGMR